MDTIGDKEGLGPNMVKVRMTTSSSASWANDSGVEIHISTNQGVVLLSRTSNFASRLEASESVNQ
jgi:hypothetical protein